MWASVSTTLENEMSRNLRSSIDSSVLNAISYGIGTLYQYREIQKKYMRNLYK